MQDSYYQFAKDLLVSVTDKLSGKHRSFYRFEFPDKPSKIIILGTLGDKSKDFGIGEEMRTLTAVKNNSMSIRFLSSNTKGSIEINVKLSLYYRVYPTYEEMRKYVDERYGEFLPKEVSMPKIWKRKDCTFSKIHIELSELSKEHKEIDLSFRNIIREINEDDGLYRGGDTIDKTSLLTKEAYEKKIKEMKNKKRSPSFNWKGKLLVSGDKYYQEEKEYYMINIMLENVTEASKRYETFFFDCGLEVALSPTIHLAPFKLEISESSEKIYEAYARALNCQAIYDKNRNLIYTSPFAYYEQKKILPRDEIDGLIFTFKELAEHPQNITLLKKLKKLMDEYYDYYKNKVNSKNIEKVEHFKNIIDRFSEGIKLLESDANVLKAFELLNETFRRASNFERWRIFQIVFIVSNLPDVVDVNKRRDICEILHVYTGGGKTESYLGLVLFSAFYDRLTGKKFGVTAITKFPLRMLSVQQLQRIAKLIAWAEEVRKENNLGGEPLSAAYFVGSSEEFPRYTKPLIDKIKKEKKHGKELPGKIIEKCPICGGDVVLDYNEDKRYVFHKCKECGREYRLYYTDEEIYRFLPTLIVGTVDKFAGISLNRSRI